MWDDPQWMRSLLIDDECLARLRLGRLLAAQPETESADEDRKAGAATYALETMKSALRSYQSAIPLDGLMWSDPEDVE
jgi:hypothetical protein